MFLPFFHRKEDAMRSLINAIIFLVLFTLPAYSQPDFGGRTHYWVAKWNAPGFFSKNDQWNGTAYDGKLIYNPRVKSGQVFFMEERVIGMKDGEFTETKNVVCYFQGKVLSTDPRLTNWWMSMEPVGTLWESVEKAALSREHPDITWAIINDMIAHGCVDPEEFNEMSPRRVFKVMENYTRLATSRGK